MSTTVFIFPLKKKKVVIVLPNPISNIGHVLKTFAMKAEERLIASVRRRCINLVNTMLITAI